MYIEAVQTDVLRAYRARKPEARNLSREERDALKALADRTGIIIKPADKEGWIVILKKREYIKQVHRQVNNASFYRRLDADPNVAHQKIIKKH